MHFRRINSAAIILAGATLLSGAAFCNAIPFLVLTENSSTSLTASLTGTTITVSVQNTSADHWTLDFFGPVSGSGSWTEPDPGSTAGNFIEAGNPTSLMVISDDAGHAGLANGATNSTGFGLLGEEMDVQFNDNSDSGSRVPDATATLPLLSLALAGLGIFAKRKKV